MLLKEAQNRKYGARPLKRAIQNLVEEPITDLLLEGNIENKLIKI
jgi:ATP-dependent Clp protease ATP-binding subunit ClpC